VNPGSASGESDIDLVLGVRNINKRSARKGGKGQLGLMAKKRIGMGTETGCIRGKKEGRVLASLRNNRQTERDQRSGEGLRKKKTITAQVSKRCLQLSFMIGSGGETRLPTNNIANNIKREGLLRRQRHLAKSKGIPLWALGDSCERKEKDRESEKQ